MISCLNFSFFSTPLSRLLLNSSLSPPRLFVIFPPQSLFLPSPTPSFFFPSLEAHSHPLLTPSSTPTLGLYPNTLFARSTANVFVSSVNSTVSFGGADDVVADEAVAADDEDSAERGRVGGHGEGKAKSWSDGVGEMEWGELCFCW